MNNFASIRASQNAEAQLGTCRVLKKSRKLFTRRRLDGKSGLTCPDSSCSGPNFSTRHTFGQTFHSCEVGLSGRRGQLVEVLDLHLVARALKE